MRPEVLIESPAEIAAQTGYRVQDIYEANRRLRAQARDILEEDRAVAEPGLAEPNAGAPRKTVAV